METEKERQCAVSEDIDLTEEEETLMLIPVESGGNHEPQSYLRRWCSLLSASAVAIVVCVLMTSVKVLNSPSPSSFNTALDPETLHNCIHSWNQNTRRYKQRLETQRAFRPSEDTGARFRFDFIEPVWDCEVKDRIGHSPFGDGPKFICDAEFSLNDSNCLVFSIGSNGDRSFEEAILAINPQCEVHTFDCTLDMRHEYLRKFVEEAPKIGFQFHDYCLGSPKLRIGNGKTLNLKQAMQFVSRPRPITHFKIDCEGCEFSSFFNDLDSFNADDPPFEQLMIEMHTRRRNVSHILNLFDRLDGLGLRLFSKERNGWGCSGVRCAEFSFISERSAFRGHVYNQCPEYLPVWKTLCSQNKILGC